MRPYTHKGGYLDCNPVPVATSWCDTSRTLYKWRESAPTEWPAFTHIPPDAADITTYQVGFVESTGIISNSFKSSPPVNRSNHLKEQPEVLFRNCWTN